MTADTVGEERERRTFLDGIAFLTGEDPSAGAFLLVVGMTTCVFIAGFQLAFPAPISYVLTALVLVVAVISFIIGAVLDILDYFDAPPEDATPVDADVGDGDEADDRSGHTRPVDADSDEAQPVEPETDGAQPVDADSDEAQPVDAGEIDVEPVDAQRGSAQQGDARLDED